VQLLSIAVILAAILAAGGARGNAIIFVARTADNMHQQYGRLG
jgi:hypothetical protein